MTASPIWFRIAAGVAVLWMAMGCYAYIMEMTATPEMMAQASEASRAIMEGRPTWSSAAFAVAVWGGLIGTILLLLRRALAVPLLWLALAATVISYAWPLFLSGIAALYSGAEWGLSIFLLVAQGAISWLGVYAQKMGWLR
jgi:CHASE2 domain-containing sensor protein